METYTICRHHKLLKIGIILSILALSVIIEQSSVSASGTERIQYYGIETHINRDFSVVHKMTLIFDGIVSDFEYDFPSFIDDFNARSEYGNVVCSTSDNIMGTKIKCRINTDNPLANKTQLIMSFNTSDSIKKMLGNYKFSSSYALPMPADSVFVMIYLPPTAVLTSTDANISYFPVDANTLTDGRHIMLYWERKNITSSDDMNFAVMYILPDQPDDLNNLVISVIALLVLIAIMVIAFALRKNSTTKIENIMPLLNTEEKKIIDVLRDHNGQSMQKAIVNETDFSKAKVSRLIKDLSERGIIEVESLGKKNRIKLKANLGKPKDHEPENR
ncbi:MAG: hypothetical protein GXO64_01755 [Candidatus Micrarchaeota archaeon]|nr:hypothetical protein [Candidatus Micrarchaeota archaeon]